MTIGKVRWREMPRRRKFLIGVGVALLLALAFWIFHVRGNNKTHGQAPAPVVVAAVERKDVPVYLDGLGTVQAYNTVTVHTQVDGQLIAVLFHEGQEVKAGDVLAKIDPRTYRAQLDQAIATKAKDAANLANAKIDLARYVNLGNSISAQTTDTQRALVKQLEATVQADQAAIDNARTLLSYTVITSPIDGRTGIRQVDMGNIVHASDANGIVVVTQLHPISVLFSLPQQDLQEINIEQAAHGPLTVLAVQADNRTVLDQGALELVDNQIDQTTGTIRLKSTFPNPRDLLWPGGFVNVRLLLKVLKGALVVPSAAVQQGPKGAYVFVLKADHTVEMRSVTVTLSEDQNSVIGQGLSEGEQVVTDGMAKLQNGSKVTLPGEAPAAAENGKGGKSHGRKQGGSTE